jgi:hypothetical protein
MSDLMLKALVIFRMNIGAIACRCGPWRSVLARQPCELVSLSA